jgi:5'-nucleotidase/UDP-sugar diphosphatase
MPARTSLPRSAGLLLSALLLSACATPAPSPPAPAPAVAPGTVEPAPEVGQDCVHVTLLHLNDIYEITPVGGGRWGGPARVATIRKKLASENPNTFALLAGDLFSPSALGTARVEGERLAGRQMVAVLNEMGLDYATFGNHEFDLRENDFEARLGEARFRWFSANVTDADGRPFPGVPLHEVIEAKGPAGTARIGLIGVTYDGIQPDYVRFSDALEAVRERVEVLRDSVDAFVAVTHLQLRQDVELAEKVPELDLILGGHDHENYLLRRGSDMTPIYKADANVRTVWVHRLAIDPGTDEVDIESELVEVTDAIPDDPATTAVVGEWLEIGFAGFRASGFDPEALVVTVPEELDGLEVSVRNRATALTELIVAGMVAEVEEADGAILNSGSIRIDDVIPSGPLTQYDVIRILPFGGPVVEVEMTGDLLLRLLDRGRANQGGGGYLQLAGFREDDDGSWRTDRGPVTPSGRYRVAISDFLLTGQEQGLDFLTRSDPGLMVVAERRDVRMALIDELRRRYGGR